jgi:hypothetical protein
MDPIELGVLGGGAVIGAAANYLNNENNRKANDREIRRISAIVDAIKDPKFDVSNISPEDFKLVAQFKPELAAYIGEKAPELVKGLSPAAQQGLDAQMSALAKYRNLSTTGEDMQSKILSDQALRKAQIQNQGQQGAISSSFDRRGQGGSQADLVTALLSQQGSNKSAQESAEDAAMRSYQTRLDALRNSTALGGDIRNTELGIEGKNANTINNFNQNVVKGQRDYENNRVNTLNDAQLKNINAAQGISNANIGQRNAARTAQQEKVNKYAETGFENDVQRAGLKTKAPGMQIVQNNADATNNANLINGLVSGLNKGASAYGAYKNGQSPATDFKDSQKLAFEEENDPDSDYSLMQSRHG